MEDLPRVVNTVTAQRHDIEVRDREGLSEEIHFAYDAELDVIAVQKKGQMRASTLRDLIADLTEQSVGFGLILRQDAWERFQRMELVKKIYFKLARPVDLAGQRQPSLMRVFQELDEFGGVSAKVEISVGRARSRWLSLNSVRQVVSGYSRRESNFGALVVTGMARDEDAEGLETVDFVHGRLIYSDQVERRGRRLDPDGCRAALRRGLRQHRAYLRRYRE
jgi:hypothetical protein